MNHYTFLSSLKEGHHAQTQKLPLHRIGMGGALVQHTKGMNKWRKWSCRGWIAWEWKVSQGTHTGIVITGRRNHVCDGDPYTSIYSFYQVFRVFGTYLGLQCMAQQIEFECAKRRMEILTDIWTQTMLKLIPMDNNKGKSLAMCRMHLPSV